MERAGEGYAATLFSVKGEKLVSAKGSYVIKVIIKRKGICGTVRHIILSSTKKRFPEDMLFGKSLMKIGNTRWSRQDPTVHRK